MNAHLLARRPGGQRPWSIVAVLFVLWGGSSAWAADTCPDEPPRSMPLRRSLAGKWFAEGQKASDDGHPSEAVKAYACSLHLVPHAFTAFNLGKAAEQAGDVEVAIQSYETYLRLAPPDDADRTVVEASLARLHAALKSLESHPPENQPPPPARVAPPTDLPLVPAGAGATSPAPPTEERGGKEERSWKYGGWYMTGVGAAVLAVGVYLNVSARNHLQQSRARFAEGRIDAAGQEWDAARTRSELSYVALGIGAGAATVGATWALWRRHTDEAEPMQMSYSPNSRGGILSIQGRF